MKRGILTDILMVAKGKETGEIVLHKRNKSNGIFQEGCH